MNACRLSCLFVLSLVVIDARAADDDAASVARGRRLFLQCAACHQVGEDTAEKIGPNLNGIVGRPVASLPGFTYSAALKTQAFAWDAGHLDRWIERPSQVAPGTTMAFIGVSRLADRDALVAYLKTLN